MGDAGYDRFLTIFSPEGRLYQIEYATQAVRKADITAVSVKGKDCVVLVCQKKTEDPRMDNKLLDHTSVTRLFSITPTIGAVVIGSIADGRSVISRARQEAAQFHYDNGYPMPVALLSKRIGDLAQLNTQHAGRRTPAVDIILGALDDEDGPQLFKVDPSGHYLGFSAVSSGKLGQECNTILEKELGNLGEVDQCVQTAVMTLQKAAGVDFTQENLEVGIIQGRDALGRPLFVKLTGEEIEQHLTRIAERD